jgi:hypothetical protein
MFPSRRAVFTTAFVLLALSGSLFGQRGAITAPRNLVELTDGADVIVRGVVLSARFEPHPQFQNLKTVVVTMKLRETLKGNAPSLYSFRQFIWDIRDRFDAAGYRKGQEILLMMTPPSEVGLTSPVGLEQGRFRIVRQARGKAQAVNGRGNAGLFTGVRAQLQQRKITLSSAISAAIQQNSGAIGIEELSGLIRQLVGSK